MTFAYRTTGRRLAAAVLILSLSATGTSFAQPADADGDCICAVPQSQFPVAKLDQISGDVRIATGQGFTPAGSDVPLAIGDRVIFQAGTAILDAGPLCQVPVGPRIILDVSIHDGAVCLSNRILETTGSPGATDTSDRTAAAEDWMSLLGTLLISGGGAALIAGGGGGGGGGGGSPASP